MERDAESWPHDVLQEWTIRAMPEDLEERVMAQMQEQWSVGTAGRDYPSQRARGGHTATVTAVAAMAAAAAALVIAIGRNTPAPDAPPPPRYIAVAADPPRAPAGHLTIEVTPHDATVEVDGVPRPGPSPFVATGLAPGPHTVRVHRDGFVEWTRTIEVPDTQLHLPITLVAGPVHGTGGLLAPPKPSPVTAPTSPAAPVAAEVKGALDPEDIRRVVRRHIHEIRTCYNRGLARNPELAGRVVVQFTIGPDGAVPVSVVQESTLSDREVGQCIAKTLKGWTFPKPEGGGNVVATYPFVLESE